MLLPNSHDTIRIVDGQESEQIEHRRFPRALLATRFELWMDDEQGQRRFTATLQSADVSVNGAFLESTFFLPLGTELQVRFGLEPLEGPPVRARARIVRLERVDAQGRGRNGFGVCFEEFYGQTEVALARLFLDLKLRLFAEEYLRSARAKSLASELERVVDALVAWELRKAVQPADVWRGE